MVSRPYEGIPLSGYSKESETPVKEENFEISKGEEYYAYYEKESTLSYVGASKTENVKVKTWYETTREGIKVIQEEKMIPTFDDKEGYTFKGYREDLENEDAEIKEGKQGSKEHTNLEKMKAIFRLSKQQAYIIMLVVKRKKRLK